MENKRRFQFVLLDCELQRRFKAICAVRGRSLRDVVTELAREFVVTNGMGTQEMIDGRETKAVE
jgi:hypothetical protein